MTTTTEMRARIANKRASYEDSAEWRHEEIEALMAENTDLAAELNATRLMCTQNGRERDRAHADLERLRTELARVRFESATLDAKRESLYKLAYIGDHRFPENTYKHRLTEIVPDLRAAEAERDRAHADLEAWARAIPDECCAVTAKDRSVAADCAAEWRRRYNDLKRQNDALVELVKYAAESSTVTTSDNPGCFWCDRESPKHARCCPARIALGEVKP